jgi:S1-C subfamily serine protease
MTRNVPARAGAFLFFLFLVGLLVSSLTFVDLRWTHQVLTQASVTGTGSRRPARPGASSDATQVQRLRQSILNVRMRCVDGSEHTGTGFIVKPGFVATAAHVLGDQQSCNGTPLLVDFKGLEHRAVMEGVSSADDLALLRINDSSLPALQIADTAAYESPNDVVRLVTIGYPLPNVGASSRDNAAISGEGTLSRFVREQNVFITSGLNLNPGNSGGPVFVRNDWKVLGIASAKLDNAVGDGIGYVASIRAFESFFREKTGQELR